MADPRLRKLLLRLAEKGDKKARRELMEMEAAERASAPAHIQSSRKRAAAERAAIARNDNNQKAPPKRKARPTLEETIGPDDPPAPPLPRREPTSEDIIREARQNVSHDPVGAGRTLRRPELLTSDQVEAEWRARNPDPRALDRFSFGPDLPTPGSGLMDDLVGFPGEWSGERLREQASADDSVRRINEANQIIEKGPDQREKLAEDARDARMALTKGHHQQNIRTLAERGAEQDPARAREIMNLESERLGLPRLRTSEERKIAHGTYGPSDPTGLEGRMLGLAPEEPEPRRLTARERSQLGQGVADEKLIDHAIATGQFDRSNLGFAKLGTESPTGVRYQESRDIPGATRVVGRRQGQLEDLLSEAGVRESEGDMEGAGSLRAKAEGIRSAQAADSERQRSNTRRSRNARSLAQSLEGRERLRPGGIEISGPEQGLIDDMTPAQRDRITVRRARGGARGLRDADQREARRQAWNAEALRRDPSLEDSLGGRGLDSAKHSLEIRKLDASIDQARRQAAAAERRGNREEAAASRRHEERLLTQKQQHEETITARSSSDAAKERQHKDIIREKGEDRSLQRDLSPKPKTPEQEQEIRDEETRTATAGQDYQVHVERAKGGQGVNPRQQAESAEYIENRNAGETFTDFQRRMDAAPGAAAPGNRGGLSREHSLPSHANTRSPMSTSGQPAMWKEDDVDYMAQQGNLLDRQLIVDVKANRPDGSEGLDSLLLRDLHSLSWRTRKGLDSDTSWNPLDWGGISHEKNLSYGDNLEFADADDWAAWVVKQPKYRGRLTYGMAREFYAQESPDGSSEPYDWHEGFYQADPGMPDTLTIGIPGTPFETHPSMWGGGELGTWVPELEQYRLEN
jgi:hypothetical protein